MSITEAMKARHSVHQYQNQSINGEKYLAPLFYMEIQQ